jgi:hypothetical protein
MNTQTTTWSKLFQAIALVLVLVAVSACSKKEGSKASVRRGVTRSDTNTPIGGNAGSVNSQFGRISASQNSVQNFVYASDPSFQLGNVQEVLFRGQVSDGYTRPAGGQMTLIIKDSFGEIQADYGCTMEVQQSFVRVTCDNSQGTIVFDGNATNSTYTGQAYFNGNQLLGNFSVATCAFLDNGC